MGAKVKGQVPWSSDDLKVVPGESITLGPGVVLTISEGINLVNFENQTVYFENDAVFN